MLRLSALLSLVLWIGFWPTVSPAQSDMFEIPKFHATVQIPPGWRRIPQADIDEEIPKLFPIRESKSTKCVAGYQKEPGRWFLLPIFTIHEIPGPSPTLKELASAAASRGQLRKKGDAQITGEDRKKLEGLQYELDEANGTLLITKIDFHPNVGDVRVVTLMKPGREGLVAIKYLVPDDEFDLYAADFDLLVRAIQFSPGYRDPVHTSIESARDRADRAYPLIQCFEFVFAAGLCIYGLTRYRLWKAQNDKQGPLRSTGSK